MIFLPIVERELRVAARKTGTFRLRVFVAVVTSLIAAGMLLLGGASSPSRTGSALFSTLVTLAFIYCLFEGGRHAADCLSEEKREGTLGLLFLTDLRGYDVVLGKLAAFAVRSYQGLFAFLPVLATALILGGITAGEFWRSAAVLANTLFFSLCLGLWVSSISRESHKALTATLFWIVIVTAVPLVLKGVSPQSAKPPFLFLVSASPGYAGFLIPDLAYRSSPSHFWISLFMTHFASWGFLAMASLIIPRAWQDQPLAGARGRREERRLRRRFGNSTSRAGLRARLLDINPMFWLAARPEGERFLLQVFVTVIGVVALIIWLVIKRTPAISTAVFSGAASMLVLVLKIWVASQSSMNLAKARQNGAVELLLATPLSVDEILRGQWLALQRFFLYPMGVVLVLKLLTLVVGADNEALVRQGFFWLAPTLGLGLFDMITFVVDLVALSWVGMWMGLSQKGPNLAFFKTLFFGLLLPAVIFCLPNVFIDLVLINWAKQKLQRQFRTVAAERFDSSETVSRSRRWLPQKGGVAVPPVITPR